MRFIVIAFLFTTISLTAANAETVMVFSTKAKKLEFGVGDIQNAGVISDSHNAKPSVVIVMSNAKGQELGDLTTNHIGEAMGLSICGELLMSGVIHAPMLGGTFTFAVPFDVEGTNKMVRELTTGKCE